MPVVETSVHTDGAPVAHPAGLAEAVAVHRERGGVLWVGVDAPTSDEVRTLAETLGQRELGDDAVVRKHRRPVLERSGDTALLVLRSPRYVEDDERVELDDVRAVVAPGLVVVLRSGAAHDHAPSEDVLHPGPDVVGHGPVGVLVRVLELVLDAYGPVAAGLENDVDEIEEQVFDAVASVSRRIYELSREVMALQRATRPLLGVLDALEDGFAGQEPDRALHRRLHRARDRVAHLVEHVDGFRSLLENVLSLNAALVAQRQNEEMRRLTEATYRQGEQAKRISSWAAILFAPTLVAAVYGMNFRHMPELHWLLGYPFALALMLGLGVTLYVIFRRRRWL